MKQYSNILEGQYSRDIIKEFLGGQRIHYIFHEIYNKVINGIDPFEFLTERDIQCAIKNSQALKPTLFIAEDAFEVLIKQ